MLLLIQSLMLTLSVLSVAEEWYATYLHRMYGMPHTRQSKLYHRYGFFLIALTGISLALLPYVCGRLSLPQALLATLANALLYWLVFDCGYSLLITGRRTPFYLGDEATIDQKLKTVLGPNAGRTKALLCAVLLVALHLIQNKL